MVRRRHADRVVAALALPLPAGRVPVRAPARGERAARQAAIASSSWSTPACSTAIATGRSTADYAKAAPDDLCVRIRIRNAGPEAGRAARAADAVVPQPLVVGRRTSRGPSIRARRRERGVAVAIAEDETARPLAARRRTRSRRPRARAAVLRERDQLPRVCSARAAPTPYPKDGINDHVVAGAATVNPAQRGTKMACWYRVTVAPGETVELRLRLARERRRRRRSTSAPASSGRSPTASARPTSTTPRCGPHGRERRRSHGDAPGLRGNGLEPAVLPLRRRALARRRSDAAAAAGGAQDRAQRRLASPQQPRHHRDARQVGVPVVRRLGPRVPLRGARAHRSRRGEAPAAAAVPRVVHAPERPAAGVRVELRRRESAGARVGGARGLPHRRRHGLRLPRAAPSTSC